MPDRATRVWTEFRPRFAVVVAVGASIVRDGYWGVVIGLVGACALVVGKRLNGTFTPEDFFIGVTELATVVTVAWVVGVLGNHLRAALRLATLPVAGTVAPAPGTMGVLDPTLGLFRLDEEVERRRSSGAPLALVLLRHRAKDAAVSPEALAAARRAIARNMGSVARDADVVFEVAPDTLGVVLPGADWNATLESLSLIASATSEATFADPVDRSRRAVAGVVDLCTTAVYADDAVADGASLLAAAESSLTALGERGRSPR